jgi:hypothetical protein
MISKCAHLNGLLLSACREVLVDRMTEAPAETDEVPAIVVTVRPGLA